VSVGQATRNAANYLSTPSPAWTGLTVAGWIQAKDISATAYSTLYAVMDNAGSYSWCGVDFADGNIKTWNSTAGFSTGLGTVAVNDWLYVALVHNGTTQTLYLSKNNAASSTISIALPARTATSIQAFLDLPANLNTIGAYLSHMRVWSAALTQAQLDAERVAGAPLVTSGLVLDNLLATISDVRSPLSIVGSLGNSIQSPYVTGAAPATTPGTLGQFDPELRILGWF